MNLVIKLSLLSAVLSLTTSNAFADAPVCEEIKDLNIECYVVSGNTPFNATVTIGSNKLTVIEKSLLSKEIVRSGTARCTEENVLINGINYNLTVSMTKKSKTYNIRLGRVDESPISAGYVGRLDIKGSELYADLECRP